jgi:hypothetical protein
VLLPPQRCLHLQHACRLHSCTFECRHTSDMPHSYYTYTRTCRNVDGHC